MVTIIDVVDRVSREGKPFVALIVQGDLEIVKSESGNLYASARKASLPSTLSLEGAKQLIGEQISGEVKKVECKPFEHVNSDGEVVYLNHRYAYVPVNSVQQGEQGYLEEPILEQEPVDEVV